MEFNNKKLERTSKIINYIISISLSVFLISLSSSVIDDIDQWQERPVLEEFEDMALINSKNSDVIQELL